MSEYVFNASSNDADNGGIHAATALVARFVETLADLDDRLQGPVRALKLPQNPWDLAITKGAHGEPVSMGEIINKFYEAGETRDLATFFDALQCYAPAVGGLSDNTIDAILRLVPTSPAPEREGIFQAICEAGYDAMQCVVTGGTLISFSYAKWDFDRALAKCGESVVEFDHACRTAHVDQIIARKRQESIGNINRKNFEATRRAAFPSLIWGQDVSEQFTYFPAEYLRLAFTRLADLDDMARRWKGGSSLILDPGRLELKNESELTMQNYEQDRRFRSAAGDMQTYEQHVWIDKGNRIHFRLNHTERTVEIGYVGKHLPTWNF